MIVHNLVGVHVLVQRQANFGVQNVLVFAQPSSEQLILRLTDKGNNFYLGSAMDFEEKVQKYFADTDAFKELSTNPFKENLQKVYDLLDKLFKDKEINGKQFTKMKPDQDKTELAHLYFNPKTHKVSHIE